jgi:hypothetical protein
MPKAFRLRADQIETLATNRGGCVASDRITVDGQLVGYMYRAAPHNELDSGWRLLAGDESNEHMRDSSRHGVYDINAIAIRRSSHSWTPPKARPSSVTRRASNSSESPSRAPVLWH